MGQQFIVTMNPATSGKSSTRSSGYHQKALAEIRNSLLPFANIGNLGENLGSSAASTISTLSTTSGVSSASGHSGISAASGSNGIEKDLTLLRQTLVQLMNMGYSELKLMSFLGDSTDVLENIAVHLQGRHLEDGGCYVLRNVSHYDFYMVLSPKKLINFYYQHVA